MKGSVEDQVFSIQRTISVPGAVASEDQVGMTCTLKMMKSGRERVLARGRLPLGRMLEPWIEDAVEYRPFTVTLRSAQKQSKKKIIRRNPKRGKKAKSKETSKDAILSCLFIISKDTRKSRSPRKLLKMKHSLVQANLMSTREEQKTTNLVPFAVRVKRVEGDIAHTLNEHCENKRFLSVECKSVWANEEVLSDRVKIVDFGGGDWADLAHYQLNTLTGGFFEENPERLLVLKIVSKDKNNQKELVGFLKVGLGRLRERFFEHVKDGQDQLWRIKPDHQALAVGLEKLEDREIEILNTAGQILGFGGYEIWIGTSEDLVSNRTRIDTPVHAVHKRTTPTATKREKTPEPQVNSVVSRRFPELGNEFRFDYQNTFGQHKLALSRKGVSEYLPRRFDCPDREWQSNPYLSKEMADQGAQGKSQTASRLEADESVAITKELKIPRLEGLNEEPTGPKKALVPDTLSVSRRRRDLQEKCFKLTERVERLRTRNGSEMRDPSIFLKTAEDRFSKQCEELNQLLQLNPGDPLEGGALDVSSQNRNLAHKVLHFTQHNPEIRLDDIRKIAEFFPERTQTPAPALPIERVDLLLMLWRVQDLSDVLTQARTKMASHGDLPIGPDDEAKLELFAEEVVWLEERMNAHRVFMQPRNKEVLLALFLQLLDAQLRPDERLGLNAQTLADLHNKHVSTYFEHLFALFISLKTHAIFESFVRLLEPLGLYLNLEDFSYSETSSINVVTDREQYESALDNFRHFFGQYGDALSSDFTDFLEICFGFCNVDLERLEQGSFAGLKSVLCLSSIWRFFRCLDRVFAKVTTDLTGSGPQPGAPPNLDDMFQAENPIFQALDLDLGDLGLTRSILKPAQAPIEFYNSESPPAQLKIRDTCRELFELASRLSPGQVALSSYQQSIIVKLKFDLHFHELVEDHDQFLYKIVFLFLKSQEETFLGADKPLDSGRTILHMELDLGPFLNLRLVDAAFYDNFSLLEFIFFYKFLCKLSASDHITLEQLIRYFYQKDRSPPGQWGELAAGASPKREPFANETCTSPLGRDGQADDGEFWRNMESLFVQIRDEMSSESCTLEQKMKTWREESAHGSKGASQDKATLLNNFIHNFSIHRQNTHTSASQVGPRLSQDASQFSRHSDKLAHQGALSGSGVEANLREGSRHGPDDYSPSKSHFSGNDHMHLSKKSNFKKMVHSQDSSEEPKPAPLVSENEDASSEESGKKGDPNESSRTESKSTAQDIGVPCEVVGIEIQSVKSPLFRESLKDAMLCMRFAVPNLCTGRTELVDSHIEKNPKSSAILPFFTKSENIVPLRDDPAERPDYRSFPDSLSLELLKLTRHSLETLATGRLPLSNLTRLVDSKQPSEVVSDVALMAAKPGLPEAFGNCTVQLFYGQEHRLGKEFRVKRRFPKQGMMRLEIRQICDISNVFGYLDQLNKKDSLDEIAGQEVSLWVSITPQWKTPVESANNPVVRQPTERRSEFSRVLIESPQKPRRESPNRSNMSLSQLSVRAKSQLGESLAEVPGEGDIPYYFDQSSHVLWRRTVHSLEDLIRLLRSLSSQPVDPSVYSAQCYFLPDISKWGVLRFLLNGCLELQVSLRLGDQSRLDFGKCRLYLDKLFEISSIEGKELSEDLTCGGAQTVGRIRVNVNYLPELMEFRRRPESNVFEETLAEASRPEDPSEYLQLEMHRMNDSFNRFRQQMDRNRMENPLLGRASGILANGVAHLESNCRPEPPVGLSEPRHGDDGRLSRLEVNAMKVILETKRDLDEGPRAESRLSEEEKWRRRDSPVADYSSALETLKELRKAPGSDEEIPPNLLAFMKEEVLESGQSETGIRFPKRVYEEDVRVWPDTEQVREISLHESSARETDRGPVERESSGKKTAIEEYKEYLVGQNAGFGLNSDVMPPKTGYLDAPSGHNESESFEQVEEVSTGGASQIELEKPDPGPIEHALIYEPNLESSENAGDLLGEIQKESRNRKLRTEKTSVVERLPKDLFKKDELERIQRILTSDRFGFGGDFRTESSESSDSEDF